MRYSKYNTWGPQSWTSQSRPRLLKHRADHLVTITRRDRGCRESDDGGPDWWQVGPCEKSLGISPNVENLLRDDYEASNVFSSPYDTKDLAEEQLLFSFKMVGSIWLVVVGPSQVGSGSNEETYSDSAGLSWQPKQVSEA